MDASYYALARQSPNKAFYWFVANAACENIYCFNCYSFDKGLCPKYYNNTVYDILALFLHFEEEVMVIIVLIFLLKLVFVGISGRDIFIDWLSGQ